MVGAPLAPSVMGPLAAVTISGLAGLTTVCSPLMTSLAGLLLPSPLYVASHR